MSTTVSGRANAAAKRTKPVNKSTRAGVLFPVARLHRYLKRLNPRTRVSVGASVYAAAVIEYLAAEVLELSGNAARDNHRSRVTPRHVFLAVSIDEELKRLLKNVTISQGGNLPYIHPFLLKNKKPAFESTAKASKSDESNANATTNGEATTTTTKTTAKKASTAKETEEATTSSTTTTERIVETTPETTTIIVKEVKSKKPQKKATGGKKSKK